MPVIYSRVNEEIEKMIKELSKEDQRTISSEIKWLIYREWLRRYGKAAPDAFKKEEEDGADA